MDNNINIVIQSQFGPEAYDVKSLNQLAEKEDWMRAIASGHARITQFSVEVATTSPRKIRQIIKERDSCFTVKEALDQIYFFNPSPTRLDQSGQKRICYWDLPVPHFVNSIWALEEIANELYYFFLPCMSGLYDNAKIHMDISPLDCREKYVRDINKLFGSLPKKRFLRIPTQPSIFS